MGERAGAGEPRPRASALPTAEREPRGGGVSVWVALALCALGAALSGLLEVVHVRAHTRYSESFCSVSERFDCTSVALSSDSVLLGLPLPVWGIVGFAAIGALVWLRSSAALWLALLAALGSIVLLAVELLRIGAVCLLCEGVHVVSIALLLVCLRLARRGELRPRPKADTLAVLLSALGALVVLRWSLPRYWSAFDWRQEPPFAQGVTEEGDPWLGAEQPKLTVIEFVDYTCPHCRAASARSLRALGLRADELRLVRAYYPRSRCDSQPDRCLPLRLAWCAGEQGKFWQADRWLFTHASWRAPVERARFEQALALDAGRLGACLDRPDISARAAGATRRARKLRIPGTPYYVVDGKALGEREVAERIRAL